MQLSVHAEAHQVQLGVIGDEVRCEAKERLAEKCLVSVQEGSGARGKVQGAPVSAHVRDEFAKV